MKGSGFIRGAAVGGFAAALVMVASTALAGTGVGGVFNLGVSNGVDQKTTLTGKTPAGSTQLQVNDTLASGGAALGAASSSSDPTAKFANSGTGPAARFQVVSGIPFTVSSSTKVPHLNADRLDSLDSTDFLRTDGTAADSQLLDGLDSSQLIQGKGSVVGAAYATGPNTNTPAVQIGPWQVYFGCPQDLTVGGNVHFNNPGSLGANVFDDYGGSDPIYFQVNSGTGLSLPTAPAGDLYTFFAQTNGVVALIHVATAQRQASNDCHFQVEATITNY